MQDKVVILYFSNISVVVFRDNDMDAKTDAYTHLVDHFAGHLSMEVGNWSTCFCLPVLAMMSPAVMQDRLTNPSQWLLTSSLGM